ncbi:tripartite tricarboxylate transporter substrate binding protein [uncultured Aeromicrobium sp.]|uniref:Bug family tripartite tricarboxylate transporter substrate binding protein n=1 Tax=uncultured Aeromicrobium sp. TaxID=337820 RepID=UPI0025F6F306|nr:tripartite tricarboxylate transporter substrate-binding protein [uncultured Aeromicrobium sp.]
MNPIKKLTAGLGAAVLAVSLGACGSSSADGGEDYPSQDLDWTIAFGPGGGNDIMSRKLAEIIEAEDLYPEDIMLENREGGSGATGWSYLYSQAGSGYGVSTTSGSFLTTPLQADTGWDYSDFTHVALLASDNSLLVVPGDSPVKDFEQWVDYATANGPVKVGGIGTVNVDFILHALIADAQGYEIDYVPFNEEGQLQTSLLSGALDAVITGPGSILGQIEAGEVTPLLFTGPERLPVLEDVPTGEELGMEDLPSMPRGFILPPDAPQEAVDWWIETIEKIVATDEWQQFLEDNYLVEDVRYGEDFTEYLDETVAEFEAQLTEVGAL